MHRCHLAFSRKLTILKKMAVYLDLRSFNDGTLWAVLFEWRVRMFRWRLLGNKKNITTLWLKNSKPNSISGVSWSCRIPPWNWSQKPSSVTKLEVACYWLDCNYKIKYYLYINIAIKVPLGLTFFYEGYCWKANFFNFINLIFWN